MKNHLLYVKTDGYSLFLSVETRFEQKLPTFVYRQMQFGNMKFKAVVWMLNRLAKKYPCSRLNFLEVIF